MTVLNLLLLSTTLLALVPRAAAELTRGPTGVEYAKRFTPSQCAGGSQTYTCPYLLPTGTYQGLPVSATPAGGSPFFLDEASTSCDYNWTSEEGNDGVLEGYAGGTPEDCPNNAVSIDTCTQQSKRTLSKLETKIRERQWKGPNRL